MFARISLFFSLFCLALPSLSQNDYRFYRNARFGTTVQYPANLVAPQPEADNGDGRKFVSRDGQIELTVYGANNALGDSLRGAMQRAISQWRGDGARLTYQKMGAGYFALSGYIGDDIFYEKTLLRGTLLRGTRQSGEVFHTLIWQYPQKERKRLDEPVTRSVRTFAAHAGLETATVKAAPTPQMKPPTPTRPATVRRGSKSRRATPTPPRGY